jgi:hypothetical protein
MAIDQAKLDRFLERFVADLGAVLAAPNVVLGDRLGLYKALAAIGPATPGELAGRTGTHERYVTEWLRGQAAGGYVTYDPVADRYLLSEEQAFTLADETSPAFVAGAFQLATSTIIDQPKVAEAFRSGEGVGWHQHHPGLFEAPSGSSAPATSPTWSTPGSRPWTGSRQSWTPARASPTWAAATAPPRSSRPRPGPGRASSASTTTARRSSGPARRPPTPA